jgi:hypothetical protein
LNVSSFTSEEDQKKASTHEDDDVLGINSALSAPLLRRRS